MSDTMNEALRVLAEHGRKLVEAAEHPLENEHPSDVEAAEDVWSGGEENIMLNIDHAEATHGADPQVTEPEVMDITELKAIVEEVVNELDEYAMALDKMDADVPDMVINHLLENGPSEAMNVAVEAGIMTDKTLPIFIGRASAFQYTNDKRPENKKLAKDIKNGS